MSGAPKPRAPVRRLHPAAEVVARTLCLWESDRRTSGDRALLIVQRLIEQGYLAGSMDRGFPQAPDNAGDDAPG